MQQLTLGQHISCYLCHSLTQPCSPFTHTRYLLTWSTILHVIALTALTLCASMAANEQAAATSGRPMSHKHATVLPTWLTIPTSTYSQPSRMLGCYLMSVIGRSLITDLCNMSHTWLPSRLKAQSTYAGTSCSTLGSVQTSGSMLL